MHTSREGLYQSCIKIGETNFGFLPFCFSFSLKWDHIGERNSNDILSQSAQQIRSPKFMHAHRKALYQGCIKNCEISNFGFWLFFFFFFVVVLVLFLTFNTVVNGDGEL